MPSLFEEPEAEPAESSGSIKDPTVTVTNSKKRKRGKKKSPTATTSEEKTEDPPAKKSKPDGEEDGANSDTQRKKKNKKKRKAAASNAQPVKPAQRSSVIQINKISAVFSGQNKAKKQNNSSKKQPEDPVKFSDDRLKAYGVNPNQFKRKMRAEKFKQKAAAKS